MSQNKEEMMLLELQKNLNSKFLLRMLKRNFKAYHNLYAIGNIIGEVYITILFIKMDISLNII